VGTRGLGGACGGVVTMWAWRGQRWGGAAQERAGHVGWIHVSARALGAQTRMGGARPGGGKPVFGESVSVHLWVRLQVFSVFPEIHCWRQGPVRGFRGEASETV
jgi:hypothetical protein